MNAKLQRMNAQLMDKLNEILDTNNQLLQANAKLQALIKELELKPLQKLVHVSPPHNDPDKLATELIKCRLDTLDNVIEDLKTAELKREQRIEAAFQRIEDYITTCMKSQQKEILALIRNESGSVSSASNDDE